MRKLRLRKNGSRLDRRRKADTNTATEKSVAVARLTFQILRRCKQRKGNFQSTFDDVVEKRDFFKSGGKTLKSA